MKLSIILYTLSLTNDTLVYDFNTFVMSFVYMKITFVCTPQVTSEMID